MVQKWIMCDNQKSNETDEDHGTWIFILKKVDLNFKDVVMVLFKCLLI